LKLEWYSVRGSFRLIWEEDLPGKGHCRSDEHWNCFKDNVGETSERRSGAYYYGFSRARGYHLQLDWFWKTLLQKLTISLNEGDYSAFFLLLLLLQQLVLLLLLLLLLQLLLLLLLQKLLLLLLLLQQLLLLLQQLLLLLRLQQLLLFLLLLQQLLLLLVLLH